MNEIWLYSLISVFIVSLLSFIGVLSLGVKVEKLKTFLIYVISFSAGTLFGDAFIHLLPEIIEEQGFGLSVSLYILLGFVIFFSLEKFVHWQHYHADDHDHGEHSHLHLEEISGKSFKKEKIKSFAYVNLIGSTAHNFIDGLIIAASYLISIPIGIATTFAVVLHEIPHEFGNFGILVHAGFSRSKALIVNFVTALAGFLGLFIALWLNSSIDGLMGVIIPIVVGGFMYIAGSDLIPELHKQEARLSSSILQIFFFVLGVAVMTALLLLE